jgi:predicted ABC-type exoprotein transport system permease subunit
VLASLESSPFAAWVRESVWGWPFWLSVHVIGTAVVIGFVIIVNLRLLGLFETIPYVSLKRLFPVIWVAFAVQVVSGFVLWTTKPTRYVADGAFVLKILFVVIGFALLAYFYRVLEREAAAWDVNGRVSSSGVKFIAPTLLAWCAVLVAARLTTYLGALTSG